MRKKRFRAAATQTLARARRHSDYNIALGHACRGRGPAGCGADRVPGMHGHRLSVQFAEALPRACGDRDGRAVRHRDVELARKHGVYIASGITEWMRPRRRSSTAASCSTATARSRATITSSFWRRTTRTGFRFGERGCPVVDTDLGRIGLLICFDGRIPEISAPWRCRARKSSSTWRISSPWTRPICGARRARYENGIWLVAATKAGYERSIYYPGGSMIVDPKGRVLSKVPYDSHGMAVCDVDPDAAADKSIYAATTRSPIAAGNLRHHGAAV